MSTEKLMKDTTIVEENYESKETDKSMVVCDFCGKPTDGDSEEPSIHRNIRFRPDKYDSGWRTDSVKRYDMVAYGNLKRFESGYIGVKNPPDNEMSLDSDSTHEICNKCTRELFGYRHMIPLYDFIKRTPTGIKLLLLATSVLAYIVGVMILGGLIGINIPILSTVIPFMIIGTIVLAIVAAMRTAVSIRPNR